MNISVNVSIIGSGDKVRIEIKDSLSRCRMIKIELTHEKFCKMILRSMAEEPCEAEIGDLSKVGKRIVSKMLEFELPPLYGKSRKQVAAETAKSICPDGWDVKDSFTSQGSFFSEGGKEMARCRICRYEEVE